MTFFPFSILSFCFFFDVALVANKVICVSLNCYFAEYYLQQYAQEIHVGPIFFTNHNFHCTLNAQFTPPDRLDKTVLSVISGVAV